MSDLKLPLEKRIAEHVQKLPKSGIRDFFELVLSMDDVISLGVGEPDFVTPWHIREATVFALEHGYTSYTSNLGLMSLRKKITSYLRKHYNLSYDPNKECLITVGVSEALDLVCRALLNPGDELIYHEPFYVSYSPEIKMAHGVPVPVSTYEENDFALEPEDLENAVTDKTKAVLLNFPCNPTGAVLSSSQMKKIADIIIRNDLILISDEIYSELNYSSEYGKYKTIASLPGMKERTVFLHGFSKAYAMTGYRTGYACGPAAIIDAMMKIHQYSMLCASIIGQKAAEEALEKGDPEMQKMKNEYRMRRNVIVRRFNEMGLSCFMPGGAFYAFPCIKSTGMSSVEFATKLLEEKQVAVVPGTAFGELGEGYLRCAYAASMEDINTAMDAIEDFIS